MYGFVLDIYNNSTQPLNYIFTWSMKNGTNGDRSTQLWHFIRDNTIENGATGNVLDTYTEIHGVNMVAWLRYGQPSQLWTVTDTSIYCPGSVKTLEIAGRNMTTDATVIVFLLNGNVN
ncbi:unnamed protein product [Rotaria socialis]|uniref:Uncharacterized protein n=1 Tax=Rotaria socialis TaxID=392032 RepID=A0A818HMW1_9BILA|nr:unnamed protein product [Rotaria socialis]CAF3370360.1 unnamed protein product [Rotaria socialis]CAF3510605.1 unnamed protein product [Rotaria socialis]CAF4481422.1 unnamed protein product [Rotaria socialis]CAF4487515.1 unnamed protein product [Rotaria socialis]